MKTGARVNPNRELLTQAQRAEKYYELLEENTRLKTHQSELDEDIKKMASRLKRIKELISKERKLAGGIIGSEFDKELDLIIDENTQLKADKKKFEGLVKSLQAQIKKGGFPKSSTKGIGSVKQSAIDKDQEELIGRLKDQLKSNIKTIDSLKEENLLLRKGRPESEPTRDIIQRMQNNDNEIVRLKWSLQEVTSNYEGLNAVLERCKKSNHDLLDEIKVKREEIINLRSQLVALEKTGGVVDDLKEQIKEMEDDKVKLEERLNELLTDPFLKRETGTSSHNRIAKLEMTVEEKDKIIRSFKEKMLNYVQQIGDLEAKVNRNDEEKKDLRDKYDELREKYEGTGEMTIDNVQKQLKKLDPSQFRKTMEDLNYHGSEPLWSMVDYISKDEENIAAEIDLNDPKSLLAEIERLKNSKREIAAELEKWQQMLKLQSNLEEEKLSMIREEAEQLKAQCKAYNAKIEDLAMQLDLKQKEIAELRKVLGGKGTYAGLKEFKFDQTMDSVSDFSEITEEEKLGIQENVLDIAVDRAEFHGNTLVQMLGKTKLKEESFNTFIAISFYDHDTQTTEICQGFSPNYATQFAFRNRFDDFYIEYLDTHTMRIEVYISKVDSPQLIGVADILLKDLVQLGRMTTSRVINGVGEIMSLSNSDVRIGTIKYKMRFRNDFQQAIRLYHDRKTANARKDDREISKAKIKWLSFEIIECKDLSVRGVDPQSIKPFWYYKFYNFNEHNTIVSAGPNPRFDDIQNYEVAYKPTFIDYLDRNSLEITVFDDSAPISEEESKAKSDDLGIIGVAKVPLQLLSLSKDVSGPISILNSKGQHWGVLMVKISVTDPMRIYSGAQGAPGLAITTLWERDLIDTICEHITKSTRFRDVDTIFDLFSKKKDKITQEDFKDAVMPLKWGFSEREISMFINSSGLFNSGKKDSIDKKEFLGIFSQPLFNAFDRFSKQSKLKPEEETKETKEAPIKTTTDFERDDLASLTIKEAGKVFTVTKQDIMENVNKIKDKIERHLKRKNQTIKDFWASLTKKKELSPKRFVKKMLKVDGLLILQAEAEIFYEFIDKEDRGKIRYEDFVLALKDVNISLLLDNFKSKLISNDEAYLEVCDKFEGKKDDINARDTFTMINNS